MPRKPGPNAGKSSPNRGRRFPAEPLTADEVERLLGAVKGNGPLAVRNRALIALIWRSGLRVSEALALRPSDVHNGTINVRNGKGNKQRTVTYDARAVGYLSAWEAVRSGLGLNGRQPLFCSVASGPTRKPGARVNPSYVRQLLPKLADRAGIDKRVHAHGLRHTHASELAAERLRLPAIALQLGHASTATTDAYLRKITAADLQDDMAAIGRTV
jgi:integrase